MKKLLLWGVVVSLMTGLLAGPVVAQEMAIYGPSLSMLDREPTGEAILFDVLILRPLGIAATGVGLAGSIVTMPFAATSCSGPLVAQKLIVEPFEYTFTRPVGDVFPRY